MMTWRRRRNGIEPDKSFLIRFFRNLMLGEKNELKNRYMLIGAAIEGDTPHKYPHKFG